MHYVKGSCIFDLVAIIPFDIFISQTRELTDKDRLLRIIKMLRIPRLFELLNVDRIK